jgi:GMP reductase
VKIIFRIFIITVKINYMSMLITGVRSSCTYVGASKLKELSKRTTFIRVTQQSNEVFGSNK